MRKILLRYLNLLAKHYLKRAGKMTIIAVAGSVGKTTTKSMIAHLLQSDGRNVRFDDTGYNNGLGLALTVFGMKTPKNLRNPFAWLILLIRCELQLVAPRPDYLVVELGIDRPGDMAEMTDLIPADYVVLTATTAEHLEYLGDQPTATAENLSVLPTAKIKALVGIDDVDTSGSNVEFTTYGTKRGASHKISSVKYGAKETSFSLKSDLKTIDLKTPLMSLAGIKSLTAALVIGQEIGIKTPTLKKFASNAQSHNGRMRLFDGLNGSQIIDDSYNSSPAAIKNALEALSRRPQKKKMMIMGMVNEMGDHLPGLLTEIGESFKQADEVILVGDEISNIMQPILKKHKVQSQTTTNALAAASLIKNNLDDNTAVLIKGSQGGVYLEESVKLLLIDPSNKKHLVRQTPRWLKLKSKFFDTSLR